MSNRDKAIVTALTANLVGAAIMMRNNKADELAEHNQLIQKRASVEDLLNKAKDLFLKRNPEFTQGTIHYTVDDSGKRTIELPGEHNVLRSLYDATRTINNDPGNHKKKALLGAAGTILGTAVAMKNLSGPLEHEIESQLGPEPTSLKSKLVALSLPASAYYIMQNRDRPSRMAVGATAAGLGLVGHKQEMDNSPNYKGIPPELLSTVLKADAGAGLAMGSFAYMSHQLQAASDKEKIKALATRTDLSDVEKAREISRITAKHDFLTRYPVLRSAPFSEKLRKWYNRFHEPAPMKAEEARDFIRTHI